MLVIAGLVLGAVLGGITATRRGGRPADIAQYAAVYAILLGLAGLFLTLAMMQMRLWEFATLAGPLAAFLLAQALGCALYAMAVAFPLMGRNYDAALMAAGVIGFNMGSTATAVAIIQALMRRHGPSPQASLIIPLTGAFFIDLVNAGVLAGFLALPWFA